MTLHIAVQHHQAGRLAEAEVAYEQVLADDPQNFDALHLSGVVAHQRGDHDAAVQRISRALQRNPANAAAHNNLGAALRALGKYGDAIASFNKALALQPHYLEAHVNLYAVLTSQGKLDEAVAGYEKLLSLKPDFLPGHVALGMILKDKGRLEAAELHFRKARALEPDSAAVNVDLGNVLNERGRPAEAIGFYEHALALAPGMPEVHLNLGNALKALNRIDEAIESYRRTLALQPDWPEVHFALGNALKEQDDLRGMQHCYRQAIALRPEFAEARWALAMSHIPAVYEGGAEPAQARARFSTELEELERWAHDGRLAEHVNAVGSMQPFLLAYQEEDNRALLQRYGSLCSSIMSAWSEREKLPRAKHGGRPIRVGVVSQQFFNHSVWHAIVKGWFERLDRERVALEAFYLGAHEDEETRFARAHASHFEARHRELRQWVDAISHRNMDVLIYPEVGMDPMTARLASLRLAPVQAASWGHPETTGLPTIDYYLSAEDFEPADAQNYYTERLIRLPRLGCFYKPAAVIPAEPVLQNFGLEADTPLFICPGVPFKYAPSHDCVFVEVARRMGHCRFVFFRHRLEKLSEKLQKRLECAFAREGLDAAKFVTFIPWQNRQEFYGWLQRGDVFLDSIGFSGFNTAMQAVECGIPIVTRQGRFMRGRFASGILMRLGLSELVAQSREDYVEIAVKLARSKEYRRLIRARIEESRLRVFSDPAPIAALEQFIAKAVVR